MAIQWGLLGQPVDVGSSIASGLQYGMQLGENVAKRNAFDAYSKNPDDPAAVARISAFDPATGERLAESQRQRQFRTAFGEAYDPATGAIDPAKARAAYVGVGDVEGAIGFDQSQATAAAQAQKTQLETVQRTAQLLDDATDEESYQRARATAQQMGMDISNVPEAYDPAWVEQQRLIVRNFVEKPEEMTSFQRDMISAGIQPGSAEFKQALLNRYAPPGFFYNGGGAATDEPPTTLSDDDFLEGGAGSGPQTFP